MIFNCFKYTLMKDFSNWGDLMETFDVDVWESKIKINILFEVKYVPLVCNEFNWNLKLFLNN